MLACYVSANKSYDFNVHFITTHSHCKCMSWLSCQEEDGKLGEMAAKPKTTFQDMVSTFVTLDIFKEMSGQFLFMFVVRESGKQEHDLFLTLTKWFLYLKDTKVCHWSPISHFLLLSVCTLFKISVSLWNNNETSNLLTHILKMAQTLISSPRSQT